MMLMTHSKWQLVNSLIRSLTICSWALCASACTSLFGSSSDDVLKDEDL